jgi:hypothetical protein
MSQVSVGQVENLKECIRDLESIREALETACREQLTGAERQCAEAQEEVEKSETMLSEAFQAEHAALRALVEAQKNLEFAQGTLAAAEAALSACEAQPREEYGNEPDCSEEAAAVAKAEVAMDVAQAAVEEAYAAVEKATANRQLMEQRVERAKQAFMMAHQTYECAQQECRCRMQEVRNRIDTGKARLAVAYRALEAYMATNPPAARFYQWLCWQPEQGKPIAPDVIRDRLNLSREERQLLQEYLYDRSPRYRAMVDKYRGEWTAAKGDVERNIVIRKVRTHLSGTYAEHLVRFALAPLGGKIETQGPTAVDGEGRYTKIDLIVDNLRIPVVLGRGEGMGAPVGGSLAFEVKCGKADYLYAQKGHMLFQAKGHKKADAHCTLCSRDIHDLPWEREKELRDALRAVGSPLLSMLPSKNEIDQSCIAFIQVNKEANPQ